MLLRHASWSAKLSSVFPVSQLMEEVVGLPSEAEMLMVWVEVGYGGFGAAGEGPFGRCLGGWADIGARDVCTVACEVPRKVITAGQKPMWRTDAVLQQCTLRKLEPFPRKKALVAVGSWKSKDPLERDKVSLASWLTLVMNESNKWHCGGHSLIYLIAISRDQHHDVATSWCFLHHRCKGTISVTISHHCHTCCRFLNSVK